MRNRSRALAALLALAASALMLLPTTTASAADDPTVTWGVRPADNDQGSGRPNYSYTLAPGSTVQDAFVVTNHGDKTISLAVYAADGFVSTSGQLDLVGHDVASTDVGAWLQPGKGSIKIKPGKSVQVPFTLTVPADATPGDHTGGIVSSMATVGDSSISVERRLGSRVHVRVAGDLAPALTVEGMSVTHSGSTDLVPRGTATVRFTVVNTGNVRLGGTVALRLHGPFGLLGTTATVPDLPELLPGSRHDVSVTVPDVPATLAVFADATVTPVVVDAAAGTVVPVVVRASGWGWGAPWLVLLVVALLVAWAVRRLVVRRRRRKGRRAVAVPVDPDAAVSGTTASGSVASGVASAERVPGGDSPGAPDDVAWLPEPAAAASTSEAPDGPTS